MVGYTQAVYSFCDEWGWNLALSEPRPNGMGMTVEEVDALIAARLPGVSLKFLDGQSYQGEAQRGAAAERCGWGPGRLF